MHARIDDRQGSAITTLGVDTPSRSVYAHVPHPFTLDLTAEPRANQPSRATPIPTALGDARGALNARTSRSNYFSSTSATTTSIPHHKHDHRHRHQQPTYAPYFGMLAAKNPNATRDAAHAAVNTGPRDADSSPPPVLGVGRQPSQYVDMFPASMEPCQPPPIAYLGHDPQDSLRSTDNPTTRTMATSPIRNAADTRAPPAKSTTLHRSPQFSHQLLAEGEAEFRPQESGCFIQLDPERDDGSDREGNSGDTRDPAQTEAGGYVNLEPDTDTDASVGRNSVFRRSTDAGGKSATFAGDSNTRQVFQPSRGSVSSLESCDASEYGAQRQYSRDTKWTQDDLDFLAESHEVTDMEPDINPDSYWHIPEKPTRFFAGRKQELAGIAAMFNARDQHLSRVGITSYGGAGKTQLMLKYAWNQRANFPGGIYIVEAEDAESTKQSFIELAHDLGVEDDVNVKMKSRTIATKILTRLKEFTSNWLICVDSANDVGILELLGDVYFPFVAQKFGHVIITSRCNDSRLWANLHIEAPIQLGPLPTDEAARCLYRCATGKGFQFTDEEIQQMIELSLSEKDKGALYALAGSDEDGLDGLPLALEQAGVYILRTKRTIFEYHKLYKSQLLNLLERGKVTRSSNTDRQPPSVATTWTINVEKLPAIVQELLATIVCIHPTRISSSLLKKFVYLLSNTRRSRQSLANAMYDSKQEGDGEVEMNFDEWVIGELVSKYSILTICVKRPGIPSFQLHRMLQMTVEARLSDSSFVEALKRALFSLYADCKSCSYSTVANANHVQRLWMIDMALHASTVLSHFAKQATKKRASQERATEQEREREGEGIWQYAGSLLEEKTYTSHISLAYELAVLHRFVGYFKQFGGHYSDAIEHLETALELFERDTSDSTCLEQIAKTACDLGNVSISYGKMEDAAKYCEFALQKYQASVSLESSSAAYPCYPLALYQFGHAHTG